MSEPTVIEQLLTVCTAVRSDVQAIIDEMVTEMGGGVVGDLKARAEVPMLFERRDELDAVIERATKFLGTNPPAT